MDNNGRKEIKIRRLAMDDVSSAARIVVDGWKEAYSGIIDDDYLNSLNVEEKIRIFTKYVDKDNFVVAIMDGEVVGFCRFIYDNSFSPNIDYIDCELMAIYVRPDLKSRGIGATMFKDVAKRLRKKNRATMLVWCLADNVDSIEFYKHMGGEIKAERLIQIGDKNYKEVGLVYDLRD